MKEKSIEKKTKCRNIRKSLNRKGEKIFQKESLHWKKKKSKISTQKLPQIAYANLSPFEGILEGETEHQFPYEWEREPAEWAT